MRAIIFDPRLANTNRLIVCAVVLGAVVLYNLGVMSYTERYREMATLKVVGFRNFKIARLLISQNTRLTVIGMIIGLPVGVGVLDYLMRAMASEYELKTTVGAPTCVVSIVLMLGVSLAVSFFVARKNRKIDIGRSPQRRRIIRYLYN